MEHFQLTERLHTDVLEDKYGPISTNVLQHTNTLREAHLIDAAGISRTFALTYFPTVAQNDEIETINKEIQNGEAIGKAFRTHHYSIRKNVLDVYIIELPKWLQDAFQTESPFAKARISEFYAKKRTSQPILYGNVVEIYTPDFRTPIINNTDISQISATTECFKKANVPVLEVWNRIGRDNDYQDIQNQFDKAKELSLPFVFDLKKKIEIQLKDYRLKN